MYQNAIVRNPAWSGAMVCKQQHFCLSMKWLNKLKRLKNMSIHNFLFFSHFDCAYDDSKLVGKCWCSVIGLSVFSMFIDSKLKLMLLVLLIVKQNFVYSSKFIKRWNNSSNSGFSTKPNKTVTAILSINKLCLFSFGYIIGTKVSKHISRAWIRFISS